MNYGDPQQQQFMAQRMASGQRMVINQFLIFYKIFI